MDDIRFSDSGVSKAGKKPDFEVTHVSPSEEKKNEPGDKVKVKFEKFVQLVATHDFEGVMKRHAEEDVILSTNLLTDLANAHEEAPSEARKIPIILIVGIIIGIAITYLINRF